MPVQYLFLSLPIPLPSLTSTSSPSLDCLLCPNQEQGYSSKTMSNLAAERHSRILTSQLQPRLHLHEWLEYHLPDGMFYYVHPTCKLVTDLNLRRDGVLDRVTAWMDEDGREDESVGVRQQWEAEEALKGPTHDSARAVTPTWTWKWLWRCEERQRERGGRRWGMRSDDDELDIEYNYWTFMEAHPAHTALLPRATAGAMGKNATSSAPLLRSFSPDKTDENKIETCIISLILICFALWRQSYFRPHKALPIDAHLDAPMASSLPTKHLRYYHPQHLYRLPLYPLSLLLLSYLVSFATLSLVTTGIAFLHHKSEMEDSSSSSMASQMHRFNEEKRIITVRNLVLSAPVVLLSYSIIAFLFTNIAHTLPKLFFWFTSIVHFVL
ncbi:hypothetical protein BJ165DRAFT_1533994 [Panaeolus papilionaceus]|nr:hypothetical protein BJ165DRAFT_1533994 [Panaeolus papilionaceus]